MEPILPYGTQSIDEEDVAYVVNALRSPFLTQGHLIGQFESQIADLCQAKFCVAFNSATSALQCAVKVLNLPNGCHGITSTNTFVASANCMAHNGLHVGFADINPQTLNVTAESFALAEKSDTRLIIPVHFAGRSCRMDAIADLANNQGWKIIEDASHAIGSRHHCGAPIGSCKYSQMTVFSFHPVKTLTTGEGGAITTNDPELYHRLIQVRSHGITRDPSLFKNGSGLWYYEQHSLGYNYRLNELQAALGISQLKKLDLFRNRRTELVNRYQHLLSDIPFVTLPTPDDTPGSCMHLEVLRIDYNGLGMDRNTFMGALQAKGVGTQVHYIPVHLQPWYRENESTIEGLCPVAEEYYSEALSIPLFPNLTDLQQDKVANAIRDTVLSRRL